MDTVKQEKSNVLVIAVMFLLFFMIAFVTNFAGSMGVIVKTQFGASNALSQLGTLANFIVLTTRQGSPTLILADTARIDNTPHHYPLTEARFDNCLIDGSISGDTTRTYRGEIALISRNGDTAGSDAFNYRFTACYILTKAITNNPRFDRCLFGFSQNKI